MTYPDDGMLRIPTPHDPNSGYASASAPAPAPAGKVFIPEMNTYVDNDLAAQLGLLSPQGTSGAPETASTALDPRAVPAGGNPLEWAEPEAEMSDEELEALQDQIDEQANREPSLSPTLDDIAACFGNSFEQAVSRMITGTNEETLATLAEATGLDQHTATNLIETAVMEVAPIASEYIGAARWGALVHAAAATPDPFAKRVVSDFTRGKLKGPHLARAYAMWWDALPDGDA